MNVSLPGIAGVMISYQPLAQRIRNFVSGYINLLNTNNYLVYFLVHEIQQNPERLIQQFNHFEPQRFIRIINHSLHKENIRHISAIDLMVNMVSLCAFSFIISPLLNNIIFKDDEEKAGQFFRRRKQVVSDFIINSLYHEHPKIFRRTY